MRMTTLNNDAFNQALAASRLARRVVVFSGAGLSADSGIPTFRDALTGLWSRFDAQTLATPEAFVRDPDLVWGWYEWRRIKGLLALPNAGHRAVADLAAWLARQQPAGRLQVLTQNVDDLHERAGSLDVVHLHGSLHNPRCAQCAAPHALPPGVPDEPEGGRRLAPPACTRCGGPVRPGVVWFGEALPQDAWAQAEDATHHADVLLVVGTSGLVYPAAALPMRVLNRGRPVVNINPDATAAGHAAEIRLRGSAAVVLPALVAAL